MFSYFVKGGPIMWVILLISIYGLGVFLERLYYLWNIRLDSRLLLSDVKGMLKEGELEEAGNTLRRTSGPLPAILKAGVRQLERGVDGLRDVMMQAGEVQMRSVEGNANHLAIIANIAPLLGLLGTVTGMIIAFNSISAQGMGNPNIVADGIATALLTTAFGLMVALPAIVAHNYIDNKIEFVRCDCEDRTNEFMTVIEDLSRGK
jgi:biopolymer transport protein ExbB